MADDIKSFILWYNSKSHSKTRYFVGLTQKPCQVHGSHPAPAWTYDKEGATILDGAAEAQKAKFFAARCGYRDLVLEPIDETPAKAKSDTVTP